MSSKVGLYAAALSIGSATGIPQRQDLPSEIKKGNISRNRL